MKTPSPERLVVLLAEDNENDLVLTRRALHQLGNLDRLIWMPDGEHTITYLKGDGRFSNRALWPLPTVLVLDQTLPRVTGLDVLHWVRSEPRFARLPALILSGNTPLTETERNEPARLHAACCPKGCNALQAAEFLAEAITSALRLAWLATLPAGRAKAAVPAPEPLESAGVC